MSEALGDSELFGVVAVASALNVDSELALRGARAGGSWSAWRRPR